MATQDVSPPTLGAQGDPCPDCGAPLAGDQRYCLVCGARRGDARLAFRDILAAQGPPSATAGAPARASIARSGAAGGAGATNTTLTFLVGLGCLLLALGVGVLIGSSGDEPTTAAAPAPQVITVNGGAPAAATTPAEEGGDTSTEPTGSSKASGSESAKGDTGSKADKQALEKLEGAASGEDYQKQSQKLPDQVGGGSGKAPPKDNKPAGGGTGFEEIG